jgi:hypothetical protein
VAIEFDGRQKYADPWRERNPAQVVWEEKQREDELRALGIRFLRATWDDTLRRWPVAEARLRALLAAPGPARRSFSARARGVGVVRSARSGVLHR